MISWFSGVGVRSVIVFKGVSFEEGVTHTSKYMQSQGRTFIVAGKSPDTVWVKVSGQAYLIEVLGCSAKLCGEPCLSLPFVNLGCWCLRFTGGVYESLYYYAGPQTPDTGVIIVHYVGTCR
jgi:hypothetical protein